jgi:hypothetical protein
VKEESKAQIEEADDEVPTGGEITHFVSIPILAGDAI